MGATIMEYPAHQPVTITAATFVIMNIPATTTATSIVITTAAIFAIQNATIMASRARRHVITMHITAAAITIAGVQPYPVLKPDPESVWQTLVVQLYTPSL